MLQIITKHVPETFKCYECKDNFRSTAQIVLDRGQVCPTCYQKRIAALRVILINTKNELEDRVYQDVKDLSYEDTYIVYLEANANLDICIKHKHRTVEVERLEEKWHVIKAFLKKVLQAKKIEVSK